MDRKLHIARQETELGILTETETHELLQAGFLVPTDLYWTEGMADWKPLAGFKPEPKGKSSPATLVKLAKQTVKFAGMATVAQAARLRSGLMSVTGSGHLPLKATANQLLGAFTPQIQKLVSGQLLKHSMSHARAAVHDDEFMRKLFGATYDCLPKPLYRFVTEEVFVRYCMERRMEWLGPPAKGEQ